MSNCRDEHFQTMLHGYELDILTEDERRDFEIHLLECDACFDRVEQFKQAIRLLNQDQEIKQVVTDHHADRIRASRPTPITTPRNRIWSSIARVSLVAAAVLAVLVLQPWDIQIKPGHEAVAAENRLAVLYFQNLANEADPDDLAPVITNLLVTDLTQAGAIDIVSTSRLYDIARMIGVSTPADLDHSHALEVGLRSSSRWVLLGNIVGTESERALTAQLLDVTSGDVMASFEDRGTLSDDIFSQVDRLSNQIGDYFGWTESRLSLGDISQITSPSLEAYRYYLTGVDQVKKLYYTEAIASFQHALQLDPGMAMAYYYLGRLLDRSLMDQAVAHIDRAGAIDQHYIRYYAARLAGQIDSSISLLQAVVARYPQEKDAWLLLAQNARTRSELEKAVDYFEHVIKLDSLSRGACNGLAYVYQQLGQVDKALWAADRYIAVAPDEPNPYDTKGDILSLNGYLKEAIEAYRLALEINPDFHHSRMYLGYMYMFDDQYARADSCFQALTFQSEASLRYAAPMYAIYPWLRRGMLDTALTLIDAYDALVSTDHARRLVPDSRPRAHFLRSTIYREQGKIDLAIDQAALARQFSEASPLNDSVSYRAYHIELLTEGGDLQAAEQELAEFAQFADRSDGEIPSYWYAAAMIALTTDNCDSAGAMMSRAAGGANLQFFNPVAIARVALECGQYQTAATLFEQLLIPYTSPRSFHGIESTKLHYYLGQAYEKLERYEDAIAQYEELLRVWRDADDDLSAVGDARARLARLTS